MKNISKVFLFTLLFLFAGSSLFAQAFFRVGEVPLPAIENAGFGNFVAGEDFDGDGLMEVYAVNNNWADNGQELIPTLYKFEFDGTDSWDLVWQATLAPGIVTQNTWPPLIAADLDEDGRREIIWGPINYSGAPADLPRVVVYEYAGDGSDNLGVADPDSAGNFKPNSTWSIDPAAGVNLRPFRFAVGDPDADGDQELLFCTRAGAFGFGVGSVDDIPNDASGTETWTLEFSGATGTFYDMALVDNAAYLIKDNGDVIPVVYASGAWTVEATAAGAAGGGSWSSATVVDIDGDNTEEIVVASWTSGAQNIYLLQVSGATVTSTAIASMSALIGSGRLYSGAAGDIDLDGNLDFVFGSRDATPNAAILRMEYQGGDITNFANYSTVVIDQEYQATGGRWMYAAIANVDGDSNLEVLYSEGTGEMAPIVVLDVDGGLPVELTSFGASVVDGFVKLSWSTATEVNNHGFEVQRKAAGSEFATVAFVKGKGTTSESQSYSFVDNSVESGVYSYRLKQVDFDGTVSYSDVVEVDLNVPSEFALNQNYPNPFNPSTTISFALAKDANVSLKVFNTLGEEVATLVNEFRNAGSYNIQFNASELASGTYIYRLDAGGVVITKKMNLLK